MAGDQVLILDLATWVGWAVGPLDGLPAPQPLEIGSGFRAAQPFCGRHRIAPTGVSLGFFGTSYRAWLFDMIAVHGPQVIVFEAPWVGGPKLNQNTARKLMGLAWETEVVAHERGVRCFEVNVVDARKHFVGRGTGKRELMKRLVMERCAALGWKVGSDDEADACALYDFTVATLGRQRRARTTSEMDARA